MGQHDVCIYKYSTGRVKFGAVQMVEHDYVLCVMFGMYRQSCLNTQHEAERWSEEWNMDIRCLRAANVNN
jgi:ferredoxin-fold anticodon binding domain-containing protein